ncbi:hypothetical protein ESCO_006455 [Escovopsis weberi]|uniref:Arrestin-like N-terminal domain-containing protein n=1 Tax=Escovopsis weberi TaxID=150374 RepID=A0A0M9VS69_ESCWE|nr:hypothetical protein ESCO_006455 [Escovopsis weberi]
MHPVASHNTSELTITVGENRGTSSVFYPGSKICGEVIRIAPIQDRHTTLTIRFFGRARVRLRDWKSPRICGRKTLFNLLGENEREILLHSDAIDIGNGGPMALSWAYAFDIPDTSQVVAELRSIRQKDMFVRHASGNLLPPSFSRRIHGPLAGSAAIVEYWLEAVMASSDGREVRATRPIRVGFFPTRIPKHHLEQDCPIHGIDGTVASYRLLVGAEDARLTVGQSLRMALVPLVVPRFEFILYVKVPLVAQAGNINFVPFTLVPYGDSIRSAVKLGRGKRKYRYTYSYSDFYVDELEVAIEEATEMLAEGIDGVYTDTDVQKHVICHYKHSWRTPTYTYLGFAESGKALRVGELLKIRIPAMRGLHPDFATYNIRVRHQFCWDLVLSCVGKKVRVKGKTDIQMLGPPIPASVKTPEGTVRTLSAPEEEKAKARFHEAEARRPSHSDSDEIEWASVAAQPESVRADGGKLPTM